MKRPLSQRLTIAIGSLGGAGFAPKAPGTVGTLVAVPLYGLMATMLPQQIYVLVTLIIIVGAIYVCGEMNKIFNEKDCKQAVIDELAGFLVTMAWLPVNWTNVVLGFGLFRMFDILKPPPVRYFDQRVKGGLGVVLDDVVAGLMANIVIRLGLFLFTGQPL